jgi:preprotein translocase SecE subunit
MKALKFLREVKSEGKKVIWSSFAQTRMLTIIVAILSVIFAGYLLLVDNVLQSIIDFIIKF